MDKRMNGSGGLLDWLVGWIDVLMEGEQTQESMNGLAGQNVTAVLNSGRTVG
jgi:hypothetical protein